MEGDLKRRSEGALTFRFHRFSSDRLEVLLISFRRPESFDQTGSFNEFRMDERIDGERGRGWKVGRDER